MKLRLLLAMTFIMFVVSIMLLLGYPLNAQAFPCIGDDVKEYCTGYHDGAIQASRDYKAGNDLDIGQHPCSHNITEYCHGL